MNLKKQFYAFLAKCHSKNKIEILAQPFGVLQGIKLVKNVNLYMYLNKMVMSILCCKIVQIDPSTGFPRTFRVVMSGKQDKQDISDLKKRTKSYKNRTKACQ